MFWGKSKIKIFLMCFLAVASLGQAKEEVLIFAAASTKPVLNALELQIEKQYPQLDIIINAAASGVLARQIKNNAPADIYLSANKKWMDHLRKCNAVEPESIKIAVYNKLVIVGNEKLKIDQLKDLKTFSKIALGNPKTVPAGNYAKESLESAKCYKEVEQNIVFTKDVRHALKLAEMGLVDAAFVYYTDALSSSLVTICYIVPENLHQPIAYYMAQTLKGKKRQAAQKIYNYLLSPKAYKNYEDYGYSIR